MSDPTLKERLATEITGALRAGEKVRLGALRMLSAAVTNREKELRHDLSDDEIRDVAAKEMKKRAESIEAFEGAGRTELAEKERAEREAIA
ncbi:MAG: GatB/YqeY domain-containing protein, partial [Actinomycetota bacterium]